MFIDGPSPGPVAQSMPLELTLGAGILTQYAPTALMNRKGFSQTRGVAATTMKDAPGHAPVGVFEQPTNVMFQLPPLQLPMLMFLVNHCCYEPDPMTPSTLPSAMKPPLTHPPSDRTNAP